MKNKIEGQSSLFEHWQDLNIGNNTDDVLKSLIKDVKFLENYQSGFYFIHDYRSLTGAYASQNIHELTGKPSEFYFSRSFDEGMHYVHSEDQVQVLIFQKKAFDFIQSVPLRQRMSIEIDYIIRAYNSRTKKYKWVTNKIKPLLLDSEGQFIFDLEYMEYLPGFYNNGFWWKLSYKNEGGESIAISSQQDKQLHIHRNVTNKEKEILQLIALGKTSKQIGEQLFISKLTVDTHRKNIKRKLDCKTTREMIIFYENHLK